MALGVVAPLAALAALSGVAPPEVGALLSIIEQAPPGAMACTPRRVGAAGIEPATPDLRFIPDCSHAPAVDRRAMWRARVKPSRQSPRMRDQAFRVT